MAVEGKSRRNKSKKQRKYGRNRVGHEKCGPANIRYLQRNRRFENKLKRVARCNGEHAAEVYRLRYAAERHEPKSLVRIKSAKR